MNSAKRLRPIRILSVFLIGMAGWLSAGANKVLIFGLDGTTPEALTAAATPHLDSLMSGGTWSLDALNRPPTVSAPGWASILTGVWNDKHGVLDDSYTGGRFDRYPCLFTRMKRFDPSLKTASIVRVGLVNSAIVTDADYTATGGSDGEAAQLAAGVLASSDPDAMFVQFKDTDYAGHRGGYALSNAEYIAAIEAADRFIGDLIDAVHGRPGFSGENWLFLAVADHGARSDGHGGNSIAERNVFFIGSGGGMPAAPIPRGRISLPAPSRALLFDGESNYTAVPDAPAFRFGATGDFTVEFLVNTQGWTGSPALVASKNRAGGPNLGFTIACIDEGRWKANLADGSGEVELNGGRIDDGRWHHLAAVYDRDGRLTLMQDGFAWHWKNIGSIGDIDSGLPIGIGQDGSLRYPDAFHGQMAELRIWKCALPESLIAAWAGRPLDTGHPRFADLIGYWKLDSDSGRTAADLGPNGVALTVEGADPQWAAPADSLVLYSYASTPRIVDVTPTALAHLSVPVHSDWGLDGHPVGIRPPAGLLSGTLTSNRILLAGPSPWRVTSDLIVPSGVTLTIEPGATVVFDANAGIKVQAGGRLAAAGTEDGRITLTRTPGFSSPWDGIEFDHTMEDNVLGFADLSYGDRQTEVILVQTSKLTIDHVTWSRVGKTIIEAEHPSLLVSNSVFPDVMERELIHGQLLRDAEYLILKGNVFGRPSGYNDVIDFSDCRRPGPVFEVYDNLFLGGGDDALDLDGCDAHIEGNRFMNFHKANGSSSTSNALATGVYNGYSPTIVVCRNVFADNDHAVLLKENSYMVAENNVFANCVHGAINFGEWPDRIVDPGRGAVLDGNIFWNNGSALENQKAQPGKTDPAIVVNRSLIPAEWHGLGSGNLDADPLFTDEYRLSEGSPAAGAGPNGLDMGAFVPAGASISGEPDSVTERTDAALTVGGPGIVAYRYSLMGPSGPWEGDYAIEDDPVIRLSGFEEGDTVQVTVRGINSAGRWQTDPDCAVSKPWIVRPVPNAAGRPSAPLSFRMFQNRPNPFNPVTVLEFELPSPERISLTVYDASGRVAADLASGRYPAGRFRCAWDARDCPSGMYTARLIAGPYAKTIKMTLVK
jgi:hypothetical protein